jgi:hypothetical protein
MSGFERTPPGDGVGPCRNRRGATDFRAATTLQLRHICPQLLQLGVDSDLLSSLPVAVEADMVLTAVANPGFLDRRSTIPLYPDDNGMNRCRYLDRFTPVPVGIADSRTRSGW